MTTLPPAPPGASRKTPTHVICLGLGYTAMVLAEQLMARGIRVTGTVRTPQKAAALAAAGIETQVWDGTANIPALAFTPETVILVSVPPDADGCPAARAFAGACRDCRVVYLSTTGVYGDRGGDWVNEASAPSPAGPRGERRLRAEADWRAVTAHTAIARLPGIYGPGRSALDRVRDGSARRIVKSGQFFSRIHVNDLAAGLEALINAGTPEGVYHFADDEPTPPETPIAFAAGLLDVEAPPIERFEDAELSPMARSFYAESKRVASAITRARLDWAPQFPSYREGLMSILALDAHR